MDKIRRKPKIKKDFYNTDDRYKAKLIYTYNLSSNDKWDRFYYEDTPTFNNLNQLLEYINKHKKICIILGFHYDTTGTLYKAKIIKVLTISIIDVNNDDEIKLT